MAIDCSVSWRSGRTIDRDTATMAPTAAATTRAAATTYQRLRAWAASFSSWARLWSWLDTSPMKP
jgi:hypothetical protein